MQKKKPFELSQFSVKWKGARIGHWQKNQSRMLKMLNATNEPKSFKPNIEDNWNHTHGLFVPCFFLHPFVALSCVKQKLVRRFLNRLERHREYIEARKDQS